MIKESYHGFCIVQKKTKIGQERFVLDLCDRPYVYPSLPTAEFDLENMAHGRIVEVKVTVEVVNHEV